MNTLASIVRFLKRATFNVDESDCLHYYLVVLTADEFDAAVTLGAFRTYADAVKGAKTFRVLIGALNNPYLTLSVIKVKASELEPKE